MELVHREAGEHIQVGRENAEIPPVGKVTQPGRSRVRNLLVYTVGGYTRSIYVDVGNAVRRLSHRGDQASRAGWALSSLAGVRARLAAGALERNRVKLSLRWPGFGPGYVNAGPGPMAERGALRGAPHIPRRLNVQKRRKTSRIGRQETSKR